MALEACQRPDFQAAVTAKVILEARTNILRKFGDWFGHAAPER